MIMPPINLWCLPRQEWYDSLWLRLPYKETHNLIPPNSRELKKQPREFMRGR